MGALALRLVQPNIEVLQSQLDMCPGVKGKLQDIVKEYLLSCNMFSLDEVDFEVLSDYRKQMQVYPGVSDTKRTYYSNLLEQVTLSYRIGDFARIVEQVEEITKPQAIKNKLILFLILSGIEDAKEVNYDLRQSFSDYIEETVCKAKISEYMKAFDLIKLNEIKKENEKSPFFERELKYSNEKVFLLYHPSYELAMTFYYLRDKEELLFDFTVNASGIMKRQIFKMLNYILDCKEDWHDRRERFLIPLKLLYSFCIDNEIEDIELLSKKDIDAFKDSMAGNVGTKEDIYIQIVDNIRKYLFISAKNVNWNANVWYLEKFSFEEGRCNPAREIKRFRFDEILIEENRGLFKEYMKYQIGVSQKVSLQTLRGIYYGIHAFLSYLEIKRLLVCDITGAQMESYIREIELKDIQSETFNRDVISVSRFFDYLVLKNYIEKIPICFDYYLKKVIPKHNNRTVDFENQVEVLHVLKDIPEMLRLMYLNLWCVGLRVNEVCVITGGAYYWDGTDAWLRIYQNKMKSEKYVPIPAMLYQLMSDYIAKNNITAEEYVFKNKRGGAYDASTFCKQMKQHLQNAGIVDYDFKSHDFRHTVATFLYGNGASIEVVRDYLGHKESDMTKQYLDYMQDLVDTKNEKYFESNPLKSILKEVKKRGK